MKLIKKSALVGVMVGTALSWSGTAVAQSVEEFYSGNTVTLLVSAPAGTLTDFLARQFGEYFAANIPGEPDVVVMNVPGAGGMVAAAQLQTGQPDDGTVIGFLQRNNLYLPLVEGDHDSFDPREVRWIGSLDKVAYTIVAMDSAAVQTAEDMFAEPLVLGATGYANDNRTLPALMNEYLGTQFRIIHGYSGREEVYLAMERGEVDGWASTIAGLARGEQAQMVADGTLNVLFHLGWTSHPAFPDVPNLSDYVTDSEVKSLFDFIILPFEAGRPIAVPEGVPEDRLAALRAAFDATVADPEFIAHMESQNYPVEAISGMEVEEILDALYATPEETLDTVRGILTPDS